MARPRSSTTASFPFAFVLLASCAYRLPAFLNAASVNSDAAIVGLQAMHILRGEWSPFLLGSGYQTSVDSFVAAAFFLAGSASPLALMLSTFVGHLFLTLFAYATLRRHLRPLLAAILVLPLVFTPSPLHTYILGPPRQAALTLVFAAVWVLDGAAQGRSRALRHGIGSALATLACFADPYAILFLPALALLALLAAFDGGGKPKDPGVRRCMGASLLGGVVGLMPLFLLWHRPGSVHGELGLTEGAILRNGRLLVGECLPWILSTTAYAPGQGGPWVAWHAPPLVRLVALVGGVLFVLGIGSGAVALRARRIPWPLRRLGLVGATMLPLTLLGFLGSVMVMDLFSTRYLAAIVLASPLAMAPAAYILGERRAALALLPYLVSAALAGWLGFGAYAQGLRPVRAASGQGRDELHLGDELARRGIGYAVADYWVSYRLTFLYRERIVVVPTHVREDRYTPYRTAYAAAPIIAYVFDPARSREHEEDGERDLLADPGLAFAERIQVGDLTALIVRRVPPHVTPPHAS